MKFLKSYIIVLLALGFLTSCEQDEEFDYAGGNQIYFENQDSITYSFAIQSSKVVTDTVRIPILIHGLASGEDRVVDVTIDRTRTTAKMGNPESGAEFNMGKTVLKADSLKTYLDVYVYRQQPLQEQEVEVVFKIVPGEQFRGDKGAEYLELKLKINDMLTKPANWDSFIINYFGDYGPVKYQFIIDVLGRHSFLQSGPDAVSKGLMSFYVDKLRTELMKYEKVNGPLMEGDVKVSF